MVQTWTLTGQGPGSQGVGHVGERPKHQKEGLKDRGIDAT